MDDGFTAFLLGMVLCVFLLFLVGTVAERQGFREGQIAALSGDAQYHLVTNDVKEIIWKKIK